MSENEKQLLPLSQDFHSIQGEGMFVGVPMHFIRVSGCNVGTFKDVTKSGITAASPLAIMQQQHPRHSICTSYSGSKFLCDTFYSQVIKRVSPDDVFDSTWENHVCITGGEPLMYDLVKFVNELTWRERDINVHIETSGTLPIPEELAEQAWITCSPKEGFLESNLPFINEFKFLIDYNTTEDDLKAIDKLIPSASTALVFLQGIDGVTSVDIHNTNLVLKILRSRPHWRLSVQLHKFLGIE